MPATQSNERFLKVLRHPGDVGEPDPRAIARARADEAALTQLALTRMPPDIRAFGERHGIPTFSEVVWLNAYIAGWRDAFRAARAQEIEEEDHG